MDYQYWNNYYNKKIAPIEPSKFAEYVLKYLEEGKKLIELGCGNGRDSLLFSKHGINVTAIDQSDKSINNLKENNSMDKIEFIADDFIKTKLLEKRTFDYVYSRFTMHSISEEEENILLQRVYETLKRDGLFLIEVRSTKDDIYGLGEKVGRNTYIYNEHCRRFIVIEELVDKLKSIGFNIVLADEADNYAIYKDQNPIVIRVIAKK
ncbi:class I SAM-dependent methyltransferase [[Clostridium] dakarense]|uniref:class I SAM-dependent methyltransferase n=1 Tax=Faecalimicrobium dakarense TaxID=1301100 RepID=UPI0004B65F76|nr:class I SAM-dependent methyltransferase [[Clostridium] dakarense]